MPTIAVFGATGQTGSEVVRQLADRHIPTRALVRSLEKAGALRSLPGIDIAQADLERPETLEAALRGIERAYFVTSGQATHLSPSFYDAARREGVRHIVRLSGSFMVRADTPIQFDRWHYEAEQALEQPGLAWTHLRPSYFMQNIFFQGATGVLALPFADRAVNMVDVRDIAAVAVAALTDDGHEGQTYDITGPEALTFFEAAARLTAITGRTFTYTPVTESVFRDILLQWGLPEAVASDLAREYAEIGAGHPAFSAPTDTVERLTGQQARGIEDFARDFKVRLTTPPQWGAG